MCGINGITAKERLVVEAMNAITSHRGPDHKDVFCNEDITLGHTRLSIIDLDSRSHQPMVSNCGRYVIVFNGEIYNFKELKQTLAYDFKTAGDTEVVLAGFVLMREKIFEKLNGMFACAIWDTQEKELYLARDSAGIKPLYYYTDGETLIFSSEIKALFEYTLVPKVLSQDAFSMYLELLYVPAPLTMFQGIYKFPAGAIGKFSDGVLKTKTFTPDAKEAIDTKQCLNDAIERHLISDKPVGVYLSGGIDSSLIASQVAKKHEEINTFSVGFALRPGEDEAKFNADFLLARRIAKELGTKHHEVYVTTQDILSDLEKIVWHLDEPISNATTIPMFVLARYAKDSVAVTLSGDGGDELFGGYKRYQYSRIASKYQSLVPKVARELGERLHAKGKAVNIPPGIDRFAQFIFQKNPLLTQIAGRAYDPDVTRRFFKETYFDEIDLDFENQFMDVDRRTWLVDEAFMRGDKMSMAHGLEVRVPFMDTEVVKHAKGISSKDKLSLFQTKKLLRRLYRDSIPSFVLNEPKRGWYSPSAKWLRYPEISSFAREILSSGYAKETKDFFDWDVVTKMLDDHIERREYNAVHIWALLTFQMWVHAYTPRIE